MVARNFVLGAVSAVALMGGAAAPATAKGLEGAYLFGGIGYTKGDLSYTYTGSTANNVSKFHPDGWMLSGGIGKTLSHQGKWSLGVEADVSAGSVKSGYVHLTSTPCITVGESCQASVNWMATGRIVATMDAGPTKPFATLGLAFANIRASADLGACNSSECRLGGMRTGWVAGIGLRHEIKPGFSVRGEILYTDFRTHDFTTAGVHGSFTYTTVRIGVQKQF